MSNQKSTGAILLNWFIGFAVIALTVIGILLIVQSNKMYEYSVKISDKALNPTNDKSPVQITPAYTLIKEGYAQALMFFSLALGSLLLLLLLPRLQNLTIGPGGIVLALREVQQNLDTVIKQANNIQSSSAGDGGGKSGVKNAAADAITNINDPASSLNNDLQKGKWGGKSALNFRKLSAVVDETVWPQYYKVDITVESTNKKFPLNGIVKFHLHNTFINPDPVIAVENGKAILKLEKVYGAFTIGAETDDGDIKLELDLAELENIPKAFRDN